MNEEGVDRALDPGDLQAAAAALRGALEQSGMDMRGVDVYVLPTSEGGSVALLSLDASQGFDLERWLNDANSQGETIYVIDPRRCTACVGHHDEPQCVVVCPVECIDPDPDHPETHDQLLAKLAGLQGSAA